VLLSPNACLRSLSCVGAFTIIVLTGCSSETMLTTRNPVTSTQSAAPLSSSEASQEFAAALAVVLRSPAARAELHRVLRASPYTKHKVHLQGWLHDPRAARIIDQLAGATKRSPAMLLTYIDSLPPLEMWLPRRAERLGWRVGDGVSVVAKFDATSGSAVGRTSAGGLATFPSALKLPEAVLAIKPMQGLILRFDPQPDRPSVAIQDPDDGEIGIRSVTHHANGDSTVLQHAEFAKLSRDKGGATIFSYPIPPDDGGRMMVAVEVAVEERTTDLP
jgi:hypothetical protein